MKYFAIIILAFVATCCFAVDQKLIDIEKAYVAAVENLQEMKFLIESEHRSLKYWLNELDKNKTNHFSSDHDRKFDRDKIDKTKQNLQDLNVQYSAIIKVIKKLSPLKEEYDKHMEIEFNRAELKEKMLNISGMLVLPLAFFGVLIWFGIYHSRKCKRLLQQGKITQEEYDNMMQCKKYYVFGDERTNPATGLRMIGGVDSGGNPSGCSFKTSSMFNYFQDYRDPHRWDG